MTLDPTWPELEIGELKRLPPGFTEPFASVAYDVNRPVVVAHTDANAAAASLLLEALTLQLLRLHATDGVELAVFEPLPGQRLMGLKRLLARTGAAYGRQLLGDGAYHDHLDRLLSLAHQRFALLANLDVPSLAHYNAHPRVRRKEPVQLLLVSEVLAQSGREGDLQALHTLCSQGPQVGIVPLLLRGSAEERELAQPHARHPLQAFWQRVQPLAWGFDWRDEAQPQPMNQPEVYWRSLRRFAVQVGVDVARTQSWVDALCEAQQQAQEEAEYPDFVRVPIGDEGNEPVHFCLGPASRVFNALLGGSVNSGKTTIVHNVLMGACEAHAPEALRLWIIDPSGVEFRAYQQLPHTEFLHCELSLTQRLLAGMAQFEAQWATRAEQLAAAGVRSVDAYNAAAAGPPLPRCLLVVDEVHTVLAHRGLRELLGRVAREGRKFGLHLIMLTPSYQELPFDNNVKGQIGLRIGCLMDTEAASRNLFGHDNPAAAHLVNGEGVRMAIVNARNGRPEGNRRVHLYPLGDVALKARIAALAQRHPGRAAPLEPTLPEPEPASARWPRRAGVSALALPGEGGALDLTA